LTKLITVWFVTSSQKVLLKEKIINKKAFLLPFEAWTKRGETILGTLVRIKNEFQEFTPSGSFKVKFLEVEREVLYTKFGKAERIHFLCELPFEPNLPKEIIAVNKENFQEVQKRIPKKDYERLSKFLGVQATLI